MFVLMTALRKVTQKHARKKRPESLKVKIVKIEKKTGPKDIKVSLEEGAKLNDKTN